VAQLDWTRRTVWTFHFPLFMRAWVGERKTTAALDQTRSPAKEMKDHEISCIWSLAKLDLDFCRLEGPGEVIERAYFSFYGKPLTTSRLWVTQKNLVLCIQARSPVRRNTYYGVVRNVRGFMWVDHMLEPQSFWCRRAVDLWIHKPWCEKEHKNTSIGLT
jgi:hypothetical protein